MILPNKTDAEIAEPHFQHPQPQSQGKPATDQIDTGQISTPDQLRDLTNRVQILETVAHGRVVFNTGLIGLYETVGIVPTGIPLSPYDQVKFYSNSTTYRLYMYDALNHVWRYATLT